MFFGRSKEYKKNEYNTNYSQFLYYCHTGSEIKYDPTGGYGKYVYRDTLMR